MLENIAWNAFENTGNIEAYMFYRELAQEPFKNKSNNYKLDTIDILENKAYNNRVQI